MYLAQSPNHGQARGASLSRAPRRAAAPQHAKLHEAAPADPSSELGVNVVSEGTIIALSRGCYCY